jgi:hypothetical protein
MGFIDKKTSPLIIAENTKGEKINIYECFFTWPSDPFTQYWVAKHSNGSDGFVIDGKRLCFKYAHESKWEDLNYSDWIQIIRNYSKSQIK